MRLAVCSVRLVGCCCVTETDDGLSQEKAGYDGRR